LNVSSHPSGKAAAERFRYSDLGKRWRCCRTLIIDEISMLNSATFAFAEEFARAVRNSNKPFGGIQVVACGDFFQLPPVARDGAVSFAFEADAWNVVFGAHNTTELKQV
jgi:ATP-dependent DNA helicase PIF1